MGLNRHQFEPHATKQAPAWRNRANENRGSCYGSLIKDAFCLPLALTHAHREISLVWALKGQTDLLVIDSEFVYGGDRFSACQLIPPNAVIVKTQILWKRILVWNEKQIIR